MSSQKSSKRIDKFVPARSELEVLKILWKYGPSSVRFVHDKLIEEIKTVQYTSTLKLMQVMFEKGMLKRDESNMRHVYSSLLKEKRTMGLILERFVESMYNGSVRNLLVAFASSDKFSKKELEKIKELLSMLEDEK